MSLVYSTLKSPFKSKFFKIQRLVPTNFEIAPLGLTAILIYYFQINCNVIKIVLALRSYLEMKS